MNAEMFPDEIINNLPENPHDGVKILINGYINFVQNTQFTPITHYEKCMDGYALIYAYNKSYDLGLEFLKIKSDNKNNTIRALNNSIMQIQSSLGGNFGGKNIN